jgi:hypothetical protein
VRGLEQSGVDVHVHVRSPEAVLVINSTCCVQPEGVRCLPQPI